MKLASWYFLGRGGSEELWYQSSLCFSAEKNSARGKVMGKKWFIRIGCLWVLQMGRWEMPHPGNLLGYRFVIKGKLEGWQGELPCLSWVDVMLPHQLLLQAEQGSFLVPSWSSVCVCTQSCLTLGDPMACSPPGSCIYGIRQARILECVVVSSSRGIFLTQGWTHDSCVSCIGEWVLYHCTTWGMGKLGPWIIVFYVCRVCPRDR